ncbi:MAG: 3-dehydroquinate synthase [Dehalococcoidia bacterium]|nr:3-dehydroquinate synthase [Dehalococcoidia bacterium]
MHAIRVSLGARSYNTYIGASALDEMIVHLRRAKAGNRLIIITNTTVLELYGLRLKETLLSAGFEVSLFSVPDGEGFKSLESAGRLYTEMSEVFADRSTTMLALGGGVIGDLAGFVAGTYMRGIPLIQLPTTLLSQVDSSIGGKTAVNYGRLKNQIGTFYQPRAVFCDTSVLKTLAAEHISNGFAEIIKSAVIGDRELFGILTRHTAELQAADGQLLETIIKRAAAVKARIVSRDEHDNGVRNTLNLGHTIGHAIESVTSFSISHGAAIAMGMVAAGRISVMMELMPPHELEALINLIDGAGLPTSVTGINVADLFNAIKHDKKATNGSVKFILPLRIGRAVASDKVTLDLIAEVLTEQ